MHPNDPRNDPRQARQLDMPEDATPQVPFFRPIPRRHLTDKELAAPISVVMIKVYGSFTKRGAHRKEIVEEQYEAEVEVPAKFNKGHIKLAINRHVKKTLKGIRARTYNLEEDSEPKPLEHKRQVKDFISSRGMRDNERLKREYLREVEKRKKEAEALAAGIAPAFADDTEYGNDGLPKFSEKTYVAQ